jgi:hypothetical protein
LHTFWSAGRKHDALDLFSSEQTSLSLSVYWSGESSTSSSLFRQESGASATVSIWCMYQCQGLT